MTTLIERPRTHEPERWAVSGAGIPQRLDCWAEILASTHVAFDVTPTAQTTAAFAGAVTRRALDDLMLVHSPASPVRGRRTPALVGSDGASPHEHILGFQFVWKGVERVREGGRELMLNPGDIVLWDGLEPTDVEIVKPFYKRTLMFPRERALSVCPRLRELRSMPPLAGSASARLLVRYMNAIALELPTLEASAAAAAATAALELLRAAVEPGLPTGRAAERTALRAEIRRYVRAHLQEPGLGPVSIARAFSISVRALHALFEDADASVAVLVRNERLARCLEDLRQRNGGSVTDIAFRWGFCDAAHFSRVFKREFGLTPSEVRHAAAADEGGSTSEI
jgi:AraC-like DNA-binding protein